MRESHERHSQPQAKNLVFPASCNEEDPSAGPQDDSTTRSRRRGKREVSRASLSIPVWSQETYREIVRVICSGRVIHGSELQRLQFLIGEKLNVQSVLLCGSGSLALELALLACGIQKGDEVVLPSFCCSSIVLPIVAIGATPVLADVVANLISLRARLTPC
jgi:dTDP-4-amino-4,6-dideoxygalactose transaminase